MDLVGRKFHTSRFPDTIYTFESKNETYCYFSYEGMVGDNICWEIEDCLELFENKTWVLINKIQWI